MTAARRQALEAVRDGRVYLGESTGRTVRAGRVWISGTALTASYRAGLWRWPGPDAPRPGDVAMLTPDGRLALGARG